MCGQELNRTCSTHQGSFYETKSRQKVVVDNTRVQIYTEIAVEFMQPVLPTG